VNGPGQASPHIAILIDEADRFGARLELVTEDFENSTVGKFIRSAKAFASELELEKIRERTVRGRLARLRSGKLIPGCKVMYGYHWRNIERTALDPDPNTSWVVQRIFKEAAEGKTVVRIAHDLTQDGIAKPMPCGEPRWSHQTILHILGNPAYAGEATGWRRDTSTTKRRWHASENQVSMSTSVVPPLVSRQTFEAIRTRLRLNREQASRNNRGPELTLLRGGFVRCGLCGSAMQVVRIKLSHHPATVYRCCRGNTYKGECKKHTIMTRLLDNAVWNRIEAILTKPEIIEAELNRLGSEIPETADLDAIDRLISNVARQQANLVDQLANFGGAVATLVSEKLGVLEVQRQQLLSERHIIEQRRDVREVAHERMKEVQSWCHAVASRLGELTYEQKRLALEALGVQAKVWPTDHPHRYQIETHIPLDLEGSDIVAGTSSPAPERTCWARAGPTACARRFAMATSITAGR
jgi:site-specific DNA recombinase